MPYPEIWRRFICYGEFPNMQKNIETLENVWDYSYTCSLLRCLRQLVSATNVATTVSSTVQVKALRVLSVATMIQRKYR